MQIRLAKSAIIFEIHIIRWAAMRPADRHKRGKNWWLQLLVDDSTRKGFGFPDWVGTVKQPLHIEVV